VGSLGQREEGLARAGAEERSGPGVARAGKGEEEECWASGRVWARERREEGKGEAELGWAKSLGAASFLLFQTQSIHTNPFEFNQI
jgi:hypothetical protein